MKYGHVVLHIPHSSIDIPPAYRPGIMLTDEALFDELRAKTDAFTDQLFADDNFPVRVISPVSRLVCDVERFRDDAQEPNAKRGEGVVYTRTHNGRPMRKFNPAERAAIIEEFYDPHHNRLTEAVDAALELYGRCTIIDCHSFHSKRPIRLSCLLRRPDICIGTDSFHTPASLRDTAASAAREQGMYVRFNTPFAGSLTPIKHYRQDRRVSSVMIEVNRRLYMDEATMQKSSDFESAHAICRVLMGAIGAWKQHLPG